MNCGPMPTGEIDPRDADKFFRFWVRIPHWPLLFSLARRPSEKAFRA
jgi:hypothetical protein